MQEPFQVYPNLGANKIHLLRCIFIATNTQICYNKIINTSIMEKKMIIFGMVVGSLVGGYIPTLFGAGIFSVSSIITGAIGALIGIWLVFRFLN